MTLSTLAAPAVPDVAAELAALLPARRNRPWAVAPGQHPTQPGAACGRLTDGVRALLVAQVDAARVEVFAEYPEEYPARPDLVADSTAPDAASSIAARVLRSVLPRLDEEIAAVTSRTDGGWDRLHGHQLANGAELGFALIDHGAHPDAVESAADGPGLIWTSEAGGTWSVWLCGEGLAVRAEYDGPVSGLYGVLPSLLAAAEGYEPTDVGSAFTRLLTDRFPQMSPLAADQVEILPSRGTVYGQIGLPRESVPTDRADDQTPVIAEFSPVGLDLLLAVVPHLI